MKVISEKFIDNIRYFIEVFLLLIGNFVQLIDVQHRNNQTLNNWLSKEKLEKYHVRCLLYII
mgnify:CR=1 FL=1